MHNPQIHHPVYEEPKVNFQREKRVGLTDKQVNELAVRLQNIIKEEGILAARNTYEYYQLFDEFCGYRGEKGKNFFQTMTDSIWYDLRDESVVTDQAWYQLEVAIVEYDPNKDTFKNFAQKQLIKQVRNKASKDNRIKRSGFQTSVEAIGREDDEGNFEPYDIEDVKANFGEYIGEDEYIEDLVEQIHEEVPGNKAKKKFILDYIVAAYVYNFNLDIAVKNRQVKRYDTKKFNVTQLAELMTEKFGGTVETNRKFINRFKKQCEEVLSYRGHRLNTTWNKDPKAYKARFYDEVVAKKNAERFEKYENFKAGL